MNWGSGMAMRTTSEAPPPTSGPDGVMRGGATCITLDTVVPAFREGLTPGYIVEQYPTLRLPDVYSVIAYALNHPDEIEIYLRGRQRGADEVRRANETRFDSTGVRDRLVARRREG